MEYRNRRELHRQGGKFPKGPYARATGLRDQHAAPQVRALRQRWTPIVATGKCPSCGTALAATE